MPRPILIVFGYGRPNCRTVTCHKDMDDESRESPYMSLGEAAIGASGTIDPMMVQEPQEVGSLGSPGSCWPIGQKRPQKIRES